MAITVRYWAAAAAATGIESERLVPQLDLQLDDLGDPGDRDGTPAGKSVLTRAHLVAALARRHPELEPILPVASLLVDGRTVHDGPWTS